MKRRIGPVERLFPMPCPLVVGGTIEHADALAVAWINVVSSTPPTIAMGLRENRYTYELIARSRSFTVNIARAEQAAIVDFFGITSGRELDKFAAAGVTLEPSALVEAPLIAECPYNLECRVIDEVQVGAYRVVLGEIVEVHVEDSVVADVSGTIDIEALDPLVYIAGAREYRRLGEKVADAFCCGRALAIAPPGTKS